MQIQHQYIICFLSSPFSTSITTETRVVFLVLFSQIFHPSFSLWYDSLAGTALYALLFEIYIYCHSQRIGIINAFSSLRSMGRVDDMEKQLTYFQLLLDICKCSSPFVLNHLVFMLLVSRVFSIYMFIYRYEHVQLHMHVGVCCP